MNAPKEDTPEGDMLFGMRALFAQYERTKIMERTRRGKERRVRGGQVMLSRSCSFGYEYVAPEKRIRILEGEAVWVVKMFEWLVYEGLSLRRIAQRLQSNGVPTRNHAKAWHPGVISQMLSNEVYAGIWHYNKHHEIEPKSPRSGNRKHLKTSKEARPREEWISVSVPAIVPRELFDAVRAQLERNQAVSPRHTTNRYLFRGLLTCARCGYKMYGSTNKHQNPNYAPSEAYECPGRTRNSNRANLGRRCDQPNVSLRRVEALVWDEVVRQLSDEKVLRKKLEEREGELKRGRKDDEAELEVLINLELGLKCKAEKDLDLYDSDIIDKEILRERMAVTREKQADLARSKAEVTSRLAQWDQSPAGDEAIKELCEIARRGLPHATFEERRAFLEGMNVALRVDGDEVTVTGLITDRTLTIADKRPARAHEDVLCHTSRLPAY